MNVSTMRKVDALLGLPMCAVLTTWHWLTTPFRRRRDGSGAAVAPVEKIMFVKLAEQGSTVLANAALRRAVEMVGAENVYFLVFDQNRGILDAMGIVPQANVIAIRAKTVVGALTGTLAALRRIWKLHIDAVVDLEFFARSTAILTYLSGAPVRVGVHAFSGDGPWRGNLMTHRVGYNPHVHTSQMFRIQVDAIDQPPEKFPSFDFQVPAIGTLPAGRFDPTPGEEAEVRSILQSVAGTTPNRLILLNANCSDLLPLRKWNDENYVDLARRLLDADPELWIAFTGAPSEAPPVDQLVERIDSKRCISMAGRTTMRQLLVLYGIADVLVTNDSGPAHFASLTPVDVVTLFGPETPRLFGVLSPRSHVIWARTACSPCVNAYNNRVSKCTDNVCMKRIGVDEVFAKVVEVLELRAGRGPADDVARLTASAAPGTPEERLLVSPWPIPAERRRTRRIAE